jgi:hypothetical protein
VIHPKSEDLRVNIVCTNHGCGNLRCLVEVGSADEDILIDGLKRDPTEDPFSAFHTPSQATMKKIISFPLNT